MKQADGASPKPKAALAIERRRDLIADPCLSEDCDNFFCGNSGEVDRTPVLIINRKRKPPKLFGYL